MVSRHVSELLMARAARWQTLAEVDQLGSIIFSVVLSASIAHLPLRDPETGRFHGLEDARQMGRPVTATAVALSMRLPLTTVRRRAATLVAAGLLIRQRAGFAVASRCFEDLKLATVAAANASDLAATLQVLATSGYAPATRAVSAGVPALPPGVVERPLLAFAMRALETFTELHHDVTAGTIFSAIVALNVRHITHDPLLSEHYAGEDAPPGDDVRRPVSLRRLARVIDLPFETVRRRVAALTAADLIALHADGVTVPTRVIVGEKLVDNNRRMIAHFETMLDTLSLLAAEGHR